MSTGAAAIAVSHEDPHSQRLVPVGRTVVADV
ncbi:hypothetical protein FHX82_007345 [Amycolatopsis bartoniae]|nr:hypothetical protein [Amycolatopsis bartoniae]